MAKKSKSLLIIEDSVSITWRLMAFLKEITNLEILGSVRNGTSGFKRIKEDGPDLVLLDIQLPGLSGIKILEMLKEVEDRPYIIVLTNNSNIFFKEKCMALGANEFYDKSVQFNHAVESIKIICNEKECA